MSALSPVHIDVGTSTTHNPPPLEPGYGELEVRTPSQAAQGHLPTKPFCKPALLYSGLLITLSVVALALGLGLGIGLQNKPPAFTTTAAVDVRLSFPVPLSSLSTPIGSGLRCDVARLA